MLLTVCLTLALAGLPLAPIGSASASAAQSHDMTAGVDGLAGRAPCHGDAGAAGGIGGDCGGTSQHCAACFVALPALAGPDMPPPETTVPARRAPPDARRLPEPGVPPGPPRLA